jgi:very-short-patch-repair endonuclease
MKREMTFKKGAEEHKRRVAENNRKRAQQPGYKEQVNANIRAAKNTPEGKLNASLGQKKAYSNPERRELQSQITKQSYIDHPELRDLRAKHLSELERTPESRKKLSESQKQRLADPNVRQTISTSLKKAYEEDPEWRERISEKQKEVMTRPETVEFYRRRMRKMWDETPDKFRPMHRWKSGNMTRIEKVVWSIVEPYGFKFEPHYYRVGNTFLLPDFVRGNLVIEVQGEYWHTLEETAERERLLNLLGMKVLFVWGEELKRKTLSATKEKIIEWIRENT